MAGATSRQNVAGFVLVGGKSTRMSRDKHGLEPFYGVYHARLLARVESALEQGRLKTQDFVRFDAAIWAVAPAPLANGNAPEELARRR